MTTSTVNSIDWDKRQQNESVSHQTDFKSIHSEEEEEKKDASFDVQT